MAPSLTLSSGQNVIAPGSRLRVHVEVSSTDADLLAVLVGPDGSVTSDDDLVFFNAPVHASGAVHLETGPRPVLVVEPARVPLDVDRVLVAVDAGDVTGGPAPLAGALVRLENEAGPVVEFRPEGLAGLRTAVLLELYRRDGGWRLRAVGQGWDSGLAGLARAYGVEVEPEEEPAAISGRLEASSIPPGGGLRRGKTSAGPARPDPDEVALLDERAALTAEVVALRSQVVAAREALVETDERALLQSVGFYEFRHPLDDAPAYRQRLDRLRADVKASIRDRQAVVTRPGWTVNGSFREGNALVRDFAALMLRSYNTEADNCVRTVRPHSMDAAVRRLDKTREAILKLGTTMGISIDEGYHRLRVEELRLVADYLAKLDLEKEQAREERARQREDAKALAELQREEARLLKERAQYEALLAGLEEAGDAAGLARARERLAAVDEGLQGVRDRAANTRTGHVYVISNQGAFGERIVKIGMTRRLDPMERVYELGNAAVPFRFDVHALIFSSDAVGLETALHQQFADRRVNRVNLRREFFYVTPAEVREALERLADSYVLQFKETADALEWRQSQATPAPSAAANGRGINLRHKEPA